MTAEPKDDLATVAYMAGVEHGADRERAAIVGWMRVQGAFWERLARKSEVRGKAAVVAHSQAGIAASYRDHADAIERGEHLPQGIEARSAMTAGHGPEDESPVRAADAPENMAHNPTNHHNEG